MNFISKLFIFSEFFNPTANGMTFLCTIIYRFIKILFSSYKRLTKIELTYQRLFRFQNSYLIINYKFDNVLWYHFSDYGATTKDNNIVFNLNRLQSNSVKFNVYGFFQRKKFVIDFTPENQLVTDRFKTTLKTNNVINFAKPINIPIKDNQSFTFKIQTSDKKTNQKYSKDIFLKKQTTSIKHTNFIKSEFL